MKYRETMYLLFAFVLSHLFFTNLQYHSKCEITILKLRTLKVMLPYKTIIQHGIDINDKNLCTFIRKNSKDFIALEFIFSY